MNVEQALRALAADDAETTVPAHVDAAVMARWDAARRAEPRSRAQPRSGAQPGRMALPSWRAVLASVTAGGCAVALLTVVFTMRPRIEDDRQTAVPTPAPLTAVTSGVAPIVPDAAAASSPPRAEARPVRVRSSVRSALEPGYVLVPDAAAMPSPLTVMRVRMPRTAFARLGVPIVNPEAEGMVDVEVLVGEDGVARSIRRVATVGWSADN